MCVCVHCAQTHITAAVESFAASDHLIHFHVDTRATTSQESPLLPIMQYPYNAMKFSTIAMKALKISIGLKNLYRCAVGVIYLQKATFTEVLSDLNISCSHFDL